MPGSNFLMSLISVAQNSWTMSRASSNRVLLALNQSRLLFLDRSLRKFSDFVSAVIWNKNSIKWENNLKKRGFYG